MKTMVEQFQCPGCLVGSDTNCGVYRPDYEERRCVSHVLGTAIGSPGNYIALGLPKGFNKPGMNEDDTVKTKMTIRLWERGEHPAWDHLNVPVWALEQDGFLFVRTFMPRMNVGVVDVIEGGTFALCPQSLNVAVFIDIID